MKKLVRIDEVVQERHVYIHYCDMCGAENDTREIWYGKNGDPSEDSYEICVRMKRMTCDLVEQNNKYCICPECFNNILKPVIEEHQRKVEDKLYIDDYPTTLPSEDL